MFKRLISAALAGSLLSVIGCGTPGMPEVYRGMSTTQASKELSQRYPAVFPVALQVNPDGSARNVYQQENLYIVVDSKDGMVINTGYYWIAGRY